MDSGPNSAGEARSHRGRPDVSGAEARHRLLLVDDDLGVRGALAQALAEDGYEVMAAADGRSALELMAQQAPELVLLDVNLPQLSGWETLARLMARKLPPHVVVITARPDQEERALAAGARIILEKPLDLPALLEVIARLVRAPEPSRSGATDPPDPSPPRR